LGEAGKNLKGLDGSGFSGEQNFALTETTGCEVLWNVQWQGRLRTATKGKLCETQVRGETKKRGVDQILLGDHKESTEKEVKEGG